MPSPRRRKLRKYNSDRKSAKRVRSAKGNTTDSTTEEAVVVVEETKTETKTKKTRKRRPLWAKKTSE